MLKDASRRKFDVVTGWAIDRLGRSLIDLPELCRQVTDAGQVAARPREAVHDAGRDWIACADHNHAKRCPFLGDQRDGIVDGMDCINPAAKSPMPVKLPPGRARLSTRPVEAAGKFASSCTALCAN